MPQETEASTQSTPLLPSHTHQPSRPRITTQTVRSHLSHFLNSSAGHYLIFALVGIDVAGIFADFLIALHVCEHSGDKGFNPAPWEDSLAGLEIISLVISSLFMVELSACIFAFGWRYFSTKWHVFDAAVIVAGFMVDVVLRGTVEEVGSLVVVGRLWRVFKIVEEMSEGAQEELEGLRDEVELLRAKVEELEGRTR